MLEKLQQQIDEVHEAEVLRKLPVMSTAARDIRLAQLDGDILRLEHEEEWHIEAAAQCGFHFDRRENADPRAVLGVSIHKRERAVA